MANQDPFPAECWEEADRLGATFMCRVMAKAPDGSRGVVAHYYGDHDKAMQAAKGLMACYPESWIEGQHIKRRASETVTLADGVADQSLIPGVAPVPMSARQIEAERQRRQSRRGSAALPCGGLWDETAKAQGSLF